MTSRTESMHRVAPWEPTREFLDARARDLIRVAAALAAFCEHLEHNEPTLPQLPIDAARRLRSLAADLAAEAGLNLATCYTERVERVEKASLYSKVPRTASPSLPGADAMSASTTWSDFQVAQILHDRQFHPDVFGLSKIDQLRHYTFHVTKLAGLLIDAIDSNSWRDFAPDRLADLAIFGVKIATACNERLPDAALSLGTDRCR
jgi:hypothetical protein